MAKKINKKNNFQVVNDKIYTPNEEEFIIKGINMFSWEGIAQANSLMNDWGFNTVRVPNYLLGSFEQPHPASDGYGTNHAIVDAFTSQDAVVIFDAHDRIGTYYEGEEWEILKDYWRDMAREFKDNPNVWFNLHNEPGNASAKPEQWVSYHRELIDLIRAEGANNLIVIDGESWGQDYYTRTIAEHAHEILDGNENIVFSLHAYDQWNSHDISKYLDELYVRDIPVIIGEYGLYNEGQTTLDASIQTLTATQEREIGRIVWESNLTSGDTQDFDGTNLGILTSLGEVVWEDLQRVEDLEPLKNKIKEDSTKKNFYSTGFFKVGNTGEVEYEFLFDGGWFQGELAVFNLEGMEDYDPGSISFIQEAARRAQTNSNLGHVLIQDSTEKALFSQRLSWENDFNQGTFEGLRSFTMDKGDRFALILTQNYTTADIVEDPNQIWQWGKMPIFSVPEANPGGDERTNSLVSVDDNGTYAMEDVRVDWHHADRDYNDFVFSIQGAKGITTSLYEVQDSERAWQHTDTGQKLLQYASETLFEQGVFQVDESGQVSVDFLYDSGWYEGEIGIFSLSGLANLDVTSREFKQEAINRALSNSSEGYVIIQDATDKSRLTYDPEYEWEQKLLTGEYKGIQNFAMESGALVGLVLNPNGSLDELLNSTWNERTDPLFSITAANHGNVQLAEISSSKTKIILAWEDVSLSLGANSNYNYKDMVLGLEGVDSIGIAQIDELSQGNIDWLNSSLGEDILLYS